MTRPLRRNMNDSSFFHIMVQGLNKELIFNTKENMKKYLDLIYKNNEGINIIAFCIMNNHAHILIQTQEIKYMTTFMQKTNVSFSKYYNNLKNRVGYVFRDRFKVQPIKDIRHLYLCVDYIHDNPVKAGICRHRKDYEFSSYYRIYNSDEKRVKNRIADILQKNITCLNNEENTIEEFEFIENEEKNKEEIGRDIVKSFLKERNIKMENLKYRKTELNEIIKILKFENNISYRTIEKIVNIGRETLRKIVNNER